MNNSQSSGRARKILKWMVIGCFVILILPLIFKSQFRKLFAVSMLGIFYSVFLINLWERWTEPVQNFVRWLLPQIIVNFLKFLGHTVVPLRSWGLVPCIIQAFLLLCLLVFGWLLAPLYYETIRNPAVQGWIRNLFQTAAPEVYRFLNELVFNPRPYSVLAENARQIFSSLNRFFSTFVLPLTFIVFTGIGALVYRPLQQFFLRAENSNKSRSQIITTYSRLFERYLVYNSIYYLILGGIFGLSFYGLNWLGIAQFEHKIILGLILTFFLGNLVVPGLGTIILTILTIGLLSIWQGLTGAIVAGSVFAFYFTIDDYLIKPVFLNWIGSGTSSEWEFGLEIIILGVVILYASFGFTGALILFPGLCFLAAYLRHQYPQLKTWVLSPLKTLSEQPAD